MAERMEPGTDTQLRESELKFHRPIDVFILLQYLKPLRNTFPRGILVLW